MGNRQQLRGWKLRHLPKQARGWSEGGKDRVHASIPLGLFEQVGQEEDAVPALPISYYSHKLIFDTIVIVTPGKCIILPWGIRAAAWPSSCGSCAGSLSLRLGNVAHPLLQVSALFLLDMDRRTWIWDHYLVLFCSLVGLLQFFTLLCLALQVAPFVCLYLLHAQEPQLPFLDLIL